MFYYDKLKTAVTAVIEAVRAFTRCMLIRKETLLLPEYLWDVKKK